MVGEKGGGLLRVVTSNTEPGSIKFLRLYEAFGRFHYQVRGTFRVQFMQGKGKIEENIPPATLRIHELTQEVRLEKIVAALGERAETKMGQIVGLTCKQPNGEPGALSTKGKNLFFVRSSPETGLCEDKLVAVEIYWVDYHGEPYHWCFDEFIVKNVHERRPGTKVFSSRIQQACGGSQ